MNIIIDSSNTGSGKSFSVSAFAKENNPQNNRIVFLVKSLKNIDVEIPDNMIKLEGRQGNIEEQGNCFYGNLIKELVAKNQRIKSICNQDCEYFSDCNFKKLRTEAEQFHIITTPNSYKPMPNDILFIDESINTLPLFSSMQIKLDDINKVLKRLNSYDTGKIKDRKIKEFYKNVIMLLDKVSTKLNELEKIDNNNLSLSETASFFDMTDYYFDVSPKAESHYINSFLNIYNETIFDYIIGLKRKNDYEDIELNFLEVLLRYIFNKKRYGVDFSNKALNLTFLNPLWEKYIQEYKQGTIKQITLLDSTATNNLLEFFKAQKLGYEEVKFSLQKEKPYITQFLDHSWTKSGTKAFDKINKSIDKIISESSGTVGIITFSHLVSELKEFGERAEIGYWGKDNRSTNRFQDCSTLILIGRFIPPENVIEREVAVLSGYMPEVCFNIEPRLLRYSNSNLAIYKTRYNEHVKDFFNAEMIQAFGRIGRGKNNNKKDLKVFVFTNEPLNIQVDRHLYISDFLDKDDLLSEKQIENIKSNSQERSNNLEKAYKQMIKKGSKVTITELQKKAKVRFEQAKIFLTDKEAPNACEMEPKRHLKILPDTSIYNNRDIRKSKKEASISLLASETAETKDNILTLFDSEKRIIKIDNNVYSIPKFCNPDIQYLDYIIPAINSVYKTKYSTERIEIKLAK